MISYNYRLLNVSLLLYCNKILNTALDGNKKKCNKTAKDLIFIEHCPNIKTVLLVCRAQQLQRRDCALFSLKQKKLTVIRIGK